MTGQRLPRRPRPRRGGFGSVVALTAATASSRVMPPTSTPPTVTPARIRPAGVDPGGGGHAHGGPAAPRPGRRSRRRAASRTAPQGSFQSGRFQLGSRIPGTFIYLVPLLSGAPVTVAFGNLARTAGRANRHASDRTVGSPSGKLKPADHRARRLRTLCGGFRQASSAIVGGSRMDRYPPLSLVAGQDRVQHGAAADQRPEPGGRPARRASPSCSSGAGSRPTRFAPSGGPRPRSTPPTRPSWPGWPPIPAPACVAWPGSAGDRAGGPRGLAGEVPVYLRRLEAIEEPASGRGRGRPAGRRTATA